MAQLCKINEATGTKRRLYFYLVQASDGVTPWNSAGGSQPSISKNGAAFATSEIGPLVLIGNGMYYAELTASAVNAHGVINGYYGASPGTVDANVVKTPSLNSIQVVTQDPYAFKSEHTPADVWSYSTRTLTDLGTGAITSIWGFLTSAILVPGSIGMLIKTNLDAQVSSKSDFNASTDEVKLAPDGLDSVNATEPSGRAATFAEMVILLYMRFFNKVTQDATTQAIYKADDATIAVDGTVSESAGTQTKGKLS